MPDDKRRARCYRKILDRGRLAHSDARNLLERLAEHRKNILRFTRRAEGPYSNNRSERDRRLAKVKQKVSGCFRTEELAHAYCRISSDLTTMANLGYNPLIALAITRKGEAVDYLKKYGKNGRK